MMHTCAHDIRPEVHERVHEVIGQALAECTAGGECSVGDVAERAAELLKLPQGQVTVGSFPSFEIDFGTDCMALAKARGWAHEAGPFCPARLVQPMRS